MSGLEIAALALTAIGAAGTIAAGKSARDMGDAENRQLRARAGQARATGQHQAEQVRRQSRIAQSRAQAVAAASGAGATDKTVLDLMGDVEEEGEYAALAALYSAEERARSDEYAGKAARFAGKQASKDSFYKAAGTLAGGATSLYARYGGGGFEADDVSGFDTGGFTSAYKSRTGRS